MYSEQVVLDYRGHEIVLNKEKESWELLNKEKQVIHSSQNLKELTHHVEKFLK